MVESLGNWLVFLDKFLTKQNFTFMAISVL